MVKNKKRIMIFYTIQFYCIWTIFELFCNNLIDAEIGNEFIQQFIKSVIIKNIVWTIPAIFLINYYKSEVYITLKEMFFKKIDLKKYLPVFFIFTVWIVIGSILQNGRLECNIKIDELIIILFVGITEEMVFRGWLLNFTIKEDKQWLSIFINAIMFLLIHFPIWIRKEILLSSFTSLNFLGIIALSIVFSKTFLKSRNILVPIVLHMYWDLLIFMFY